MSVKARRGGPDKGLAVHLQQPCQPRPSPVPSQGLQRRELVTAAPTGRQGACSKAISQAG